MHPEAEFKSEEWTGSECDLPDSGRHEYALMAVPRGSPMVIF